APTLTLIKNVINDNLGNLGPDDFGISVGGAGVTSGATNPYDANTPLAINEILPEGYEFVSITGDAKCPVGLGGTVTLDEGEDVTCTITNDDIEPAVPVPANNVWALLLLVLTVLATGLYFRPERVRNF
ncbi:MAG: hypothetical protein KJO85_05870, partial [Gammaproteobacteria bacterium]|nr:hypothetical protein [Gammaproteobacteria bacterium]